MMFLMNREDSKLFLSSLPTFSQKCQAITIQKKKTEEHIYKNSKNINILKWVTMFTGIKLNILILCIIHTKWHDRINCKEKHTNPKLFFKANVNEDQTLHV